MLKPRFIHFEAVEGADAGGGGGDVAPEAAAPETPWSPSQNEWQEMTSFYQQAAPFLNQLAQSLAQGDSSGQEGGGGEPPELDLFDQDSVGQFINHSIGNAFNERFGDFEGLLGMLASEKGAELARDEMQGIKNDIGDFDEDMALIVTRGIMSEPGADPSDSLRSSARYVRDYTERIKAEAVEAYRREVEGIVEGDGQVPAGTGAYATTPDKVPTGPGRYEEAVGRALARRRAAPAGTV